MPAKKENKFVGFTRPDGERIKESVLTTEKYFPTSRKFPGRTAPTVTGIIWASINTYNATDKKYAWTRMVIDDETNAMESKSDWGGAEDDAEKGYAVEVTGKDFVYPGTIVQLHPAQDKDCYLFVDHHLKAYGILDEELEHNDSATCSIYTSAIGHVGDIGQNVEVWDHLINDGGAIASGTRIYLEWWPYMKRWYISGVGCA